MYDGTRSNYIKDLGEKLKYENIVLVLRGIHVKFYTLLSLKEAFDGINPIVHFKE